LPQHHDGRSVAAVAVAAHDVACRAARQRERAFAIRFDLVRKLVWVDRIASGLLLLAPVILILVRAPFLFGLQIVAGLALLAARVAVHVVTLPVELDASFGKALPVLERGRYLSAADMPAARTVLRAAAFTYVASALMTLLNIARWFRVLRF
jgi:Zn-dependent membrane protease YugP